MSTAALHSSSIRSTYQGLRLSAREYLALAPDGHDYELIDGIVIMSPSPAPQHQHVTGTIYRLLAEYLDAHPVGMVFLETDLNFSAGSSDDDLVYRPELVFVRRAHLGQVGESVDVVPDMALEVISPASRRLDTETKKNDYERFGVLEYWLVDPARETLTFFRLDAGRYIEIAPSNDRFASQAVPGFELDLARVRKSFQAW